MKEEEKTNSVFSYVKLLVILLAGILALGVVFLVFRNNNKPVYQEETTFMEESVSPAPEIREEDNIIPVNSNESEAGSTDEAEITTETTAVKKFTFKNTAAKKAQSSLKPAVDIVTGEVSSTVEVNNTDETVEKDVVVTKEYKARGIYRYIYTPSRFLK